MGEPGSLDPIPNVKTSSNAKKAQIKVCSWNIRRGLILREQELKSIIQLNKLNIIFLVETDTSAVNSESDYKIEGFRTIIQNKKEQMAPTRIVGLIDETLTNRILIRHDLTSNDFPSLWIEIENERGPNTICGGFYREWAPKGDNTIAAQVGAMEIFTEQIERAAAENKDLLIMGDANLCSERWDSPNFKHKQIADELKETLTQCGLTVLNLGKTYLADRLNPDGNEIESCLDHIYASETIKNSLKTHKLDNSATDHLPIIACFETNKAMRNKSCPKAPVYKRSMKNFNKTRWIDCLRTRNWENINNITDLNEQTNELTRELNLALDECAPYRSFKPRVNYRPGLSDKARSIMKERDLARKKMTQASDQNKESLRATYKQLRNRAINQIRTDTLEQNATRISEAKNEGEVWKVVNEIIKPKSDHKIVLTSDQGDVTEDMEVATRFNEFFVKQIETLKEKIDPSLINDPLARIQKKVENMNLKFSIRQVTVKEVRKIMKNMSKKKSKGNDGISQECLLLGLDVLAAPLTKIINNSITSGVFPDQWKEAIVVPILKKGDTKDPKNYRPVSCLVAASKVLEKAVCEQLTRFIEVHKLLPNSQHGFRAGRSTMTALSSMQKDWIKKTEEGLTTGILIWDLSAAFDTLDIDLFQKKLQLYGADYLALSWFRSFLTGRTQRVRIGSALSKPLTLTSGVPQGGILSPIVFTLYTADMGLWLKHSKSTNFTDDTTTDYSGSTKEDIKNCLEGDALRVLSFMASNGLVANQSKTEFLVLNEKNKTDQSLYQIQVGDATVTRTESTKLLGIQIDEAQNWKDQYKSLKTALNQRLFVIRRIKRQITKEKIMTMVHSLWVSKLRYGLQLCTRVQILHDDKKSTAMKALQQTQNRMLRAINNSKIADRVSVTSMLTKFNLLSVNQLAAQIKLTEVWKSVNIKDYAISLDPYNKAQNPSKMELRPKPTRIFDDTARLANSKYSFNVDSARLWNLAPTAITQAQTLSLAKRAILTHVKTLPV